MVLTGRTQETQTSSIYLDYFSVKELLSWGLVAKPTYSTDIFKGYGKETPVLAETAFDLLATKAQWYSHCPAVCSVKCHFPQNIKREVESRCFT